MSARLASGVLVSALLRKVGREGGNGAILAKGDETAGALLLLIAERGRTVALRERGLRQDGTPGWIPAGPADPGDLDALASYLDRRRRFDSDIWIVELDGMTPDAIDRMLEDS
jgi:hypothetical protein